MVVSGLVLAGTLICPLLVAPGHNPQQRTQWIKKTLCSKTLAAEFRAAVFDQHPLNNKSEPIWTRGSSDDLITPTVGAPKTTVSQQLKPAAQHTLAHTHAHTNLVFGRGAAPVLGQVQHGSVALKAGRAVEPVLTKNPTHTQTHRHTHKFGLLYL